MISIMSTIYSAKCLGILTVQIFTDKFFLLKLKVFFDNSHLKVI